ncbi:Protein unc-80 [Aphelenchoides besseyi]|nr:Protein unc-80 [Aphelenchoides besseyi]
MYVRYLQHQHCGTVQLLMMPLNTAVSSVKSSKRSERMDENESEECEPVPLPIQTFLWRQTNPFLGAKIGKLHEASCVTFERVVVQNILHGISPSLSDAIASVSRWRFVRAAFPHIVQCCGALLSARLNEDENLQMNSSLVKILYILHWLVLDAAAECSEMNLNGSDDNGPTSVRHLTYSVPCIQMFVYLITPLCHVIKEEEIENHIRLESGLRLWQAFWQFRQPDLLCFSAPVKQRRNKLPQLTVSRRAPVITATEQGIYLGDEPAATGNRRSSQSPATATSSIAASTKLSLGADSSSSKDTPSKKPFTVIPIPERSPSTECDAEFEHAMTTVLPPTKNSTVTQFPLRPTQVPSTGIVRSVSDYKTSELAGNLQSRMSLRKSQTDVFYQSPDSDPFNGIRDLDEAMRFTEDSGSFSEIFQFNDRAPLVQLQEICSAASIDASDSINGEIRHESKPCVYCKRFPCACAASSISPLNSGPPTARTEQTLRKKSIAEDSSSMGSQQTIINRAIKSQRAPLLQFDDSKKDSISGHSEDKIEPVSIDPHEATYLDVATMRCLLIRNWSEDGVYWGVKYLLNRLADIRQYRCSHEGPFRSRSNSVPTVAAVRGSRNDVLNAEYLTWADLQERSNALDRRTCGIDGAKNSLVTEDEGSKTRVAFNIERAPVDDSGKKLKVMADQRRISVNTLPATKKISRIGVTRRPLRSKSEPSLYQPEDVVNTTTSNGISTNGNAGKSERESTSQNNSNLAGQFFPEAIGSTMFIEKNGHLSLNVILKILSALIERCSAIRVLELVLNACDTLLTTPNCETLNFFEGIVKICVKTYIHLGCPNGCNEGMRTPQADFMRIKLKNLFSQMHKLGQPTLTEILRTQVVDTSVQSLLDCLHSMTAFCDLDANKAKTAKTGTTATRRRSSTVEMRLPSYRNNFNENQSGMEGIILNTLLNPLVSKLMSKLPDLYLPENMGLYQDVRMLVACVYEYHGNPLRRTALSALACRIGGEDGEQGSDTRSNSETTSTRFGAEGSLSSYQRDNASLRRGLFKKKGDKFATVNADDSEIESSPSTPRNMPSADESMSNIGSPLLPHGSYIKKKSGGKLHFAFNLLKSSARTDASEDENWDESVNLDELASEDTNTGLSADSKSRISFRNASQKLSYSRQRQSLSIDNSYTDIQGLDKPAVNPAEIPFLQLYLPPRKLINLLDAREGARRFSFLLETCKPGQLPDAPLIAALLELKAPVLSRAIIFLECANFVHRCNHGNWPEWIRSGSAMGSVRNANASSFTSGPNRTVAGGSRKTFLLQRSAGRSFYDWAIQIGARLQKMCERDDEKSKEPESKRRLKLLDDIEDFLDDGTVNDANNESCPPALQLMACQLLYQITAFLRETFQLIPRSKIAHKTAGSTSGWEKLMSHRRWSILSNTFNQQGSIHSINDLHPTYGPERRVSYSTADEESSPRGSHDLADDQPLVGSIDKKDRHEGNNALLALHRLTSRGRLFSRETSLSTATDDGHEHGSAVKILRSQHTIGSSGSASSPSMTAQVIGTMIVPDSVRRLAQGRQRLLKRGSPSGGTQGSLESSRRRRETSFRLRKQSKSPTGLENDELASESVSSLVDRDTGFFQRRRKAASLRSAGVRWNMRSMRLRGTATTADSPKLVHSPLATATQSFSALDDQALHEFTAKTSIATTTSSSNQSPIIHEPRHSTRVPLNAKTRDSLKPSPSAKNSTAQDDAATSFDTHTSPERRTGTTNSVSGSHHGPHPTTNPPTLPCTAEDDEEEMLKNMPWIKVMIGMMKQFDVNCTHEKSCTPWCFDRVYRQCKRLTDSFRVVYEDASAHEKKVDRRKQLSEAWQSMQDTNIKKRSSNPRRESAIVRQTGIERVPLALRGLLIEKLSEIEETKSTKKESNNVVETTSIDLSELTVKKHPVIGYIQNRVFNLVHSPLSSMLKSAVIMTTDQYRAVVGISWSLLIHADANTVATAAAMFICCSVKCADDCINTIKRDLSHNDASVRSAAIRRFYALWRNRFHVWLKMEDGAQLIFKVPPPGIDFTLPSPPIGQSQHPVVDPPWMPHVKTKVEELSLKEEEHSTSQTIMTMTRTRRKQKQEMVKKAVREAEERQYELRQHFPLRATAVVQQAAYEPALFQHQAINLVQQQQQQQNAEGFNDDYEMMHSVIPARQQMPVAQPLFPSSILSVVPQIVEMFDDVQVDRDGCSVGDVCRRTAWSCIIEDSSLFLRHFLEKLTHRDKQEYLFALLRKLILAFRPLPSQTAYSLLNYLFGFVMFYVRTPCEGSDKSMGLALSVIWLVTPYVHGLYFKDLKQTLKKEQCDQALMITANVPSAKKIIVHGPDSSSGGIPSQFPIHEDTQFQQILTDSLDFFNIPEDELDHYFLVDSKTGFIHNPTAYVRDFYFFHRSFYPQLTLAKMDPNTALYKMKTYAFQQKLIETGKVLLTHNALRHSPESVIPQRIFFLHDEFTHLPSFPRRSVESCFGMYQGAMGNELQAIDSMHKFVWSKLVSDMFEKMENAFMFGDLHLFINVINGIVIIHCEDVLIIRRCMATYLTMAIHFSTLFASNGFFLIMPTLLRCYSQRQTNKLFKQVIEFVCKQFYILHRKPFLLQMFGSIADICDQNNNDLEINAMQIKAKYLFNLLLAMEMMNDLTDQLDILTLVPYPKPLKALDLCYRDDPNSFLMLPDAMASCVTVCAFSSESKRSHQMLLIMQAILPHFIAHQEAETLNQNNSPAALKHEITSYTTMCVEMKTLVNSCEALLRGPTRNFDIVNAVNERGKSFIADSPQFFDPPTVADDEPKMNTTNTKKKKTPIGAWDANADNMELQKEIFRGPRDAFLLLCALFIEKAGARLKELTKLAANVEHTKIPEVFDHKCHVKIGEVAMSLLKVAPYDLSAMCCQGLQKYFTSILPIVDWSVETNRSALNLILRRLDKTIAKIAKKPSVRKRANWTAIGNWLTGLYRTLCAYPYIAHLHSLKAITQMCLRLTVGDHCTDEVVSNVYSGSNPMTILNASVPPQSFCNIVLRLTAFLMQALGQMVFSLEIVCSQEGVGVAAERLEAILCHILIPLFLMAAVPGKEAPQFQAKDLNYCLTLMYNTICPPLAKQSLAPTTTGTLANTLIRGATHDASGRQGSVSVMDRGHSATVSTHRIIRDSAVQSIFLAMKAMVLAFHRQMTSHWVKFGKIAREMISKRLGGSALFSFIEFLLSINLPISLIIYPVIQNKLNQKPNSEQEAHWFNELRERVAGVQQTSCDNIKGYNLLLTKLQHELQQMRDDFSIRTLDVPRSHTPTIGDLHSDSGSTQSVSTHRSGRPATASTETRRLSSSTAFSKLRGAKSSVTSAGPGSVTSAELPSHNLHDATILEDIEDETTQMITGKVPKSPSLPSNRATQSRKRSITGLGMFRSVRRKSRYFTDDEDASRQFEMRDIHRRTKSWNKRLATRNSLQTEDTVLITPLTMPESQLRPEASTPTSKTSECQHSVVSGNDRPRMVSFSTPKHSRNSQATSDTDSSDEYYITARHHLI